METASLFFVMFNFKISDETSCRVSDLVSIHSSERITDGQTEKHKQFT